MHTHSHSTHDHVHAARGTRLTLAFVLTATMMVLEAIGGWWSGSLALLTDAAHMLVDALALLMAVVAARVALRPADARRSYGYARIEVLSGFASAILQGVLIVFIVVAAVRRLWAPEPILSGVMFGVALAGLGSNVLVLALLHQHEADDVNMGGAWLHVLGDLLGSVAAVTAALLVRWLGWIEADPILSILVSLMILVSAWRLLRRSAHILLEGVPDGLPMAAVMVDLGRAHPAILDVHHVHVWQLASGSRMATLHVGVPAGTDIGDVVTDVRNMLAERYAIHHTTVQVETRACVDDADETPARSAHAHH